MSTLFCKELFLKSKDLYTFKEIGKDMRLISIIDLNKINIVGGIAPYIYSKGQIDYEKICNCRYRY